MAERNANGTFAKGHKPPPNAGRRKAQLPEWLNKDDPLERIKYIAMNGEREESRLSANRTLCEYKYGNYNLFVYDTQTRAWFREDGARAVGFAFDGDLFMLDYQGRLWLLGKPRGSWAGNPDPNWNAYAKQYLMEGDRATRDAYASAAGMSGGMMSSAAMTAATQAGDTPPTPPATRKYSLNPFYAGTNAVGIGANAVATPTAARNAATGKIIDGISATSRLALNDYLKNGGVINEAVYAGDAVSNQAGGREPEIADGNAAESVQREPGQPSATADGQAAQAEVRPVGGAGAYQAGAAARPATRRQRRRRRRNIH